MHRTILKKNGRNEDEACGGEAKPYASGLKP